MRKRKMPWWDSKSALNRESDKQRAKAEGEMLMCELLTELLTIWALNREATILLHGQLGNLQMFCNPPNLIETPT